MRVPTDPELCRIVADYHQLENISPQFDQRALAILRDLGSLFRKYQAFSPFESPFNQTWIQALTKKSIELQKIQHIINDALEISFQHEIDNSLQDEILQELVLAKYVCLFYSLHESKELPHFIEEHAPEIQSLYESVFKQFHEYRTYRALSRKHKKLRNKLKSEVHHELRGVFKRMEELQTSMNGEAANLIYRENDLMDRFRNSPLLFHFRKLRAALYSNAQKRNLIQESVNTLFFEHELEDFILTNPYLVLEKEIADAASKKLNRAIHLEEIETAKHRIRKAKAALKNEMGSSYKRRIMPEKILKGSIRAPSFLFELFTYNFTRLFIDRKGIKEDLNRFLFQHKKTRDLYYRIFHFSEKTDHFATHELSRKCFLKKDPIYRKIDLVYKMRHKSLDEIQRKLQKSKVVTSSDFSPEYLQAIREVSYYARWKLIEKNIDSMHLLDLQSFILKELNLSLSINELTEDVKKISDRKPILDRIDAILENPTPRRRNDYEKGVRDAIQYKKVKLILREANFEGGPFERFLDFDCANKFERKMQMQMRPFEAKRIYLTLKEKRKEYMKSYRFSFIGKNTAENLKVPFTTVYKVLKLLVPLPFQIVGGVLKTPKQIGFQFRGPSGTRGDLNRHQIKKATNMIHQTAKVLSNPKTMGQVGIILLTKAAALALFAEPMSLTGLICAGGGLTGAALLLEEIKDIYKSIKETKDNEEKKFLAAYWERIKYDLQHTPGYFVGSTTRGGTLIGVAGIDIVHDFYYEMNDTVFKLRDELDGVMHSFQQELPITATEIELLEKEEEAQEGHKVKDETDSESEEESEEIDPEFILQGRFALINEYGRELLHEEDETFREVLVDIGLFTTELLENIDKKKYQLFKDVLTQYYFGAVELPRHPITEELIDGVVIEKLFERYFEIYFPKSETL